MTDNADNNPPHWTAIYYQYSVRSEEEHDSLQDAVVWLWLGEEQGRLAADDIRHPHGTLLGEDETRRLLDEYERHGRITVEQT